MKKKKLFTRHRAIEDDVSIKGINSVASETINDATLTGNLSANAKLLSDLTPPVTPDSTPMSIGNSPNFKQQPQSFLLLNQSIVTKKHVRIKPNQAVVFNFLSFSHCMETWEFQQVPLIGMLCESIVITLSLFCSIGDENQTFHTRQSVATELTCGRWYFLRYGRFRYAWQ